VVLSLPVEFVGREIESFQWIERSLLKIYFWGANTLISLINTNNAYLINIHNRIVMSTAPRRPGKGVSFFRSIFASKSELSESLAGTTSRT
jgi:hypothetical protein